MDSELAATFFDRYPRFYETSSTGPVPERLGPRYRAIVEGNEHLLRGKHVLDLASHDGRWSFAACKAGAAHVTGIEARAFLVDRAYDTFRHYGIPPDRFRFITGDAFEVLRRESPRADTVLLLGFFYHINAHVELAELVSRTGASHVILDTGILPDRYVSDGLALIRFYAEPTGPEQNAVGPGDDAIVGHPSRSAINLIFGRFGYVMSEVDWSPMLGGDVSAISEYANGSRATFVLSRPQTQDPRHR